MSETGKQSKTSRETELEKRIAELEAQILAYQYKTGEKQRPPEAMTLNEYLDGIEGNNKELYHKDFTVTGAVIADITEERDLFFFKALYVELQDSEGKIQKFRVDPNSKKGREELKKELQQSIRKESHFIVQAYPKGSFLSGHYYFLNGYVKGKENVFFRE